MNYARFVKGLILVGLPTALVIVQPDLGTASVLIAMMMGVLLIAGAKAKYILLITFLSAATVGAAVVSGIVNDYQIKRITVFFDQNSTDSKLRDLIFQGRNSLRAIATGGIDGKGWLQGQITNTKDIPVQWADFPFSAIGEQFGLIGCGVVIGLFVDLAAADLADRRPVARHARHLPVRRRVHHGALADVPEHRHERRADADHRPAPALHLLRRVEHRHVFRLDGAGAERAHAPVPLTIPW